MKIVLLLALLSNIAYCQDVPYFTRSSDKQQDIGAYNQNFRDLVDRRDVLSQGDTPKQYKECIGSPLFCVDKYNGIVTLGSNLRFNASTYGLIFGDGTTLLTSPITSTGTIVANLNTIYAALSTATYTVSTLTVTGTYTFYHDIIGSITGNSGSVTNGVYTSGSYSDPAWLTSLSIGKISLSTVTSVLDAHAAALSTAVFQNGVATLSSVTVLNSGFSVGGSTLVVDNGRVSIGNYHSTGPVYTEIYITTTDATGGTISSYTAGGNIWWVHQFKSTGTFTFKNSIGVSTLNVVVVGGGGGGCGGGGGAGQFISSTSYPVSSGASYTVVVGSGGVGAILTTTGQKAMNGVDSVFDSTTAYGGGGGGNTGNNGNGDGKNGGSGGGGGAWGSGTTQGGISTGWQGHAGGTNGGFVGAFPSGGGGGASAVGSNASAYNVPGNGGAGVSSSITGSAVYYAGGGGAACYVTAGVGSGGVGGGGAGINTSAGIDGTVNLGGGGGGVTNTYKGGTGGTGVVIVSYVLNPSIGYSANKYYTLDVTGDIITDKYYGDGSTLSNIITSTASLVASTGTIQTQVNSIAVSTGTLWVSMSTTTVKVMAVAASTGTLWASMSTTTARIEAVAVSTGILTVAGYGVAYSSSLPITSTATIWDTFYGVAYSSNNYLFQHSSSNYAFQHSSGNYAFVHTTGAYAFIHTTEAYKFYWTTNTVPGDSFGSHIATQAVTINFPVTIGSSLTVRGVITSTSEVNAAYYQIAGSTVLSTFGAENIFIGTLAGAINTGIYNTFVGEYAGYHNTVGAYGTFLGWGAGYANQGEENTFIGKNSGLSNTTGNGNAFLGTGTGQRSIAGSGNTFIGKEAGYGSSGSISSSTLIGFRSGFSLSNGADNLFIGYKAGYAVTTGTGNIIIGYNKDTSGATASNELNIGGILTGNLNPGGGITVSTLTVTGNSGQYGLTVSSGVNLAGLLYTNNGNVGIGTTNPSATKLAVVGNIGLISSAASTDVRIGNTTGGLTNSDFYMSEMNTGEAQLRLYGAYPMSFWTNNAQRVTILSGGNVGIGTVSPTSKFDVYGGISALNDIVSSGTFRGNLVGNVTGNISGNAGTVTSGVYTNAANIFSGVVNPITTPSESWIGPSNTAGVYFKNGKVGIGHTAPARKLDVRGGTDTELWIVNDTDENPRIVLGEGLQANQFGVISWNRTGNFFRIEPNGANNLVLQSGIDGTGNVGIGTTAPSALLSIQKGAAWSKINAGDSAWIYSSSKDLKENIQYLQSDSVKFSQLKPAQYNFKIDKSSDTYTVEKGTVTTHWQVISSTASYGLLAEDVHAIYPEQPAYEINGNFIQAQMINAIVDLQKRIKILEAK